MPRKKRDAPVSYRPPESLRAEFYARVMNSGLGTNAYITRAVFGSEFGGDTPRARRESPLDQQMAAQLLSQAARIHDLLRSPLVSTDPAHSVLLTECRAELTEIRTCLMQVLGRDP